MATLSSAEGFLDSAEQLHQFVALGIELAILDQDGSVAIGDGADDYNAGKDEPKPRKDSLLDRPMGEPLHEPAGLGDRRLAAVKNRLRMNGCGRSWRFLCDGFHGSSVRGRGDVSQCHGNCTLLRKTLQEIF